MPEPGQLCVFVAAKSDPGREPDKQVNEDAMGYRDIGGSLLAVVCDGMGGHAGGRLASHTAVDSILMGLATASPDRPTRERFSGAIVQASSAVHRIGGDAPTQQRPGATCVAVWLHLATLEVAHVGDSRCYRWRKGNLEALTRDHSVIEAWIQAGHVPRDQAHLHPDAHRITRALGIEPSVEVELRSTEGLLAGDRYLLCSDGLTDLVPETDLAAVLGRSAPLPQLTEELVSLANQRGGHDNITALLLEVADCSLAGSLQVGPQGAAPCFALTAATVTAAVTEQVPLRPGVSERTLPLNALDRTIIMDERTELLAHQAAQSPIGKTQPLRRMDDPGAQPPAFVSHSMSERPAANPSPRQFWLLVGVALILIGFAIAIGVFRR